MKYHFLPCILGYLICGLLFPGLVSAQATLDIQVGMNLSSAAAQDPDQVAIHKNGNFLAGLSVRQPVNRQWNVRADLRYIRRGFAFESVYQDKPGEGLGLRVAYTDLALNLEYHAFQNIRFELGSYAGYRLTEEIQLPLTENWIQPAALNTAPWDIGLQAGVAAHFQRWSAFVRYSRGVKAIRTLQLTYEDGGPAGTLKLYNTGLQIGIGYACFTW